jgi:hypothetical protein
MTAAAYRGPGDSRLTEPTDAATVTVKIDG